MKSTYDLKKMTKDFVKNLLFFESFVFVNRNNEIRDIKNGKILNRFIVFVNSKKISSNVVL